MTDLERAKTWSVKTMGFVGLAEEHRVEALAREFAQVRLPLEQALLEVEWSAVIAETSGCCPSCAFTVTEGHGSRAAACPIDEALTASGLPDQASRDAQRTRWGLGR